jgi:hypothetical protein
MDLRDQAPELLAAGVIAREKDHAPRSRMGQQIPFTGQQFGTLEIEHERT